jgi:hypothetical protein
VKKRKSLRVFRGRKPPIVVFEKNHVTFPESPCYPGRQAYNLTKIVHHPFVRRTWEGPMEEANSGGDQAGPQDALEFEIEVIDREATGEELDRMTRHLLSELEETDVESAARREAKEIPSRSGLIN